MTFWNCLHLFCAFACLLHFFVYLTSENFFFIIYIVYLFYIAAMIIRDMEHPRVRSVVSKTKNLHIGSSSSLENIVNKALFTLSSQCTRFRRMKSAKKIIGDIMLAWYNQSHYWSIKFSASYTPIKWLRQYLFLRGDIAVCFSLLNAKFN